MNISSFIPKNGWNLSIKIAGLHLLRSTNHSDVWMTPLHQYHWPQMNSSCNVFNLLGGWTNPFEKNMIVKIGNLPQIRTEHKNIFETTTYCRFFSLSMGTNFLFSDSSCFCCFVEKGFWKAIHSQQPKRHNGTGRHNGTVSSWTTGPNTRYSHSKLTMKCVNMLTRD